VVHACKSQPRRRRQDFEFQASLGNRVRDLDSNKQKQKHTQEEKGRKKREKRKELGHWWLTPITLATQEAEIRRIQDQGQLRKIIHEILSQKYPTHTKNG
jgi:hypothetical protein